MRVTDPAFMRTSVVPDLVPAALALMPGLKRHRCECGSAHGIEAELADTETPHLLEHVTLELMALAGSSRALSGRTTWDFDRDGQGVFRVALRYDDDLVALGALKEGVGVTRALLYGETPDVDACVARVRQAAGRDHD